MAPDGGEWDPEAALLRRVEEAVDRAQQLREQSESLPDAPTRDVSQLTARCAWCGRYRVGGGWVVAESVLTLVLPVVETHVICEDCVADLRARGLSV
jgi:hypothetical protein